tara:strand:+ start:2223 stop:2912 length:690 start_codon:yes stop_codon:yes gene_type:complete
MPDHIGKLDNPFLTEKSASSFLFEPKGLVHFETAWNWQNDWRNELLKNPMASQAIWLLEHSTCYTIGRGGNQKNVLFDIENSSAEIFRIDRGGDVTHHLPGQLVVYLVIDLTRYKKDLYLYLRQLEQVLIDLLNCLGLPGQRLNGYTGVWCNGLKVASIGVGCRRWITQHGLSLNVNCDLAGFHEILPCGLNGSSIGKLDDWIPGIKIEEVKQLMKKCLSKRFGLIWHN